MTRNFIFHCKPYHYETLSVLPPHFIKLSFLVLLSFSILHPYIVFANIAWNDTAYYFNERGQLLWYDVHEAQPISYVIRTKKANNEIFQDIPQNDGIVQLSADYDTALVSNISKSTARRGGLVDTAWNDQ